MNCPLLLICFSLGMISSNGARITDQTSRELDSKADHFANPSEGDGSLLNTSATIKLAKQGFAPQANKSHSALPKRPGCKTKNIRFGERNKTYFFEAVIVDEKEEDYHMAIKFVRDNDEVGPQLTVSSGYSWRHLGGEHRWFSKTKIVKDNDGRRLPWEEQFILTSWPQENQSQFHIDFKKDVKAVLLREVDDAYILEIHYNNNTTWWFAGGEYYAKAYYGSRGTNRPAMQDASLDEREGWGRPLIKVGPAMKKGSQLVDEANLANHLMHEIDTPDLIFPAVAIPGGLVTGAVIGATGGSATTGAAVLAGVGGAILGAAMGAVATVPLVLTTASVRYLYKRNKKKRNRDISASVKIFDKLWCQNKFFIQCGQGKLMRKTAACSDKGCCDTQLTSGCCDAQLASVGIPEGDVPDGSVQQHTQQTSDAVQESTVEQPHIQISDI